MQTVRDRLADAPADVIAACVDNLVCSLDSAIDHQDAEVKPITAASPDGVVVYKRSLVLALIFALKRCQPDMTLLVEFAMGEGYACKLRKDGEIVEVDSGFVSNLSESLGTVIAEDLAIESVLVPIREAQEWFQQAGQTYTAELLNTINRGKTKVPCMMIDDGTTKVMTMAHDPPVPSTGSLKLYEVSHYSTGLLLRYPAAGATEIIPFVDRSMIAEEYRKRIRWGEAQGLGSVMELTNEIREGRTCNMVQLTEALHDAQLVNIAQRVFDNAATVKLLLIAGPSSSGKTTFAKRLEVQLKTLGLKPVVISVDSYYKHHKDLVPMPNGQIDWEDINALNLDQLNDSILTLLDGKEALIPEYDMKTSTPVPESQWEKVTLPRGGCIIMEGIHCLNPDLTAKVDASMKLRIAISPLSPLRLDDNTVIGCTKLRLMRRMVRDYLTRGRSAQMTLSQWPSVVRGESCWIYPHQEEADCVMNSGNVYELCVLKGFAELLLQAIPPSSEQYNLAQQLLHMFKFVPVMGAGAVPPQSLLREFIGGSWYYDHAGWPKHAPY